MSRSKGSILTKKHRVNISKSLTGHAVSEKTRNKMSKNNGCYWLGKKKSKSSFRLYHKKNCQCSFCKAKRGERTDKNHPSWKGDKAKYFAMHWWAKKYIPKSDKCPICNKKKKLELSNVDHKYRRRLKDYKYMCGVCHKAYDKRMKQRNLVTLAIRLFIQSDNISKVLKTLNLQSELF